MQKVKSNGQTAPAKAAPPAPPASPAPPADPLAFVDELPTRMRTALVEARVRGYTEGMRRAASLVAIAVGSLDGDSKQRLMRTFEQLEDEAAKGTPPTEKPAEKTA